MPITQTILVKHPVTGKTVIQKISGEVVPANTPPIITLNGDVNETVPLGGIPAIYEAGLYRIIKIEGNFFRGFKFVKPDGSYVPTSVDDEPVGNYTFNNILNKDIFIYWNGTDPTNPNNGLFELYEDASNFLLETSGSSAVNVKLERSTDGGTTWVEVITTGLYNNNGITILGHDNVVDIQLPNIGYVDQGATATDAEDGNLPVTTSSTTSNVIGIKTEDGVDHVFNVIAEGYLYDFDTALTPPPSLSSSELLAITNIPDWKKIELITDGSQPKGYREEITSVAYTEVPNIFTEANIYRSDSGVLVVSVRVDGNTNAVDGDVFATYYDVTILEANVIRQVVDTVDVTTAGTYTITYSATDKGTPPLTTTATRTVTVQKKPAYIK